MIQYNTSSIDFQVVSAVSMSTVDKREEADKVNGGEAIG